MKLDYRWKALILLWVAFFLQQGTRQMYGATLSSIQGSLGVSPAQIGLVGTIFTFAYGICVPFAGVAADMLNRKWMVISGVFVFCLGIFCSGFVAGLGMLLLTYGLLNGIGQSFYYPSATSILGQLHKETRATAFSILQMGLYTGIVGCSAAAGFLAESGTDGWRLPFKVFGGLGIIWAAVMVFCLKNTKPDAPSAAADGSAPVQKATLKEAFSVLVSNPAAVMLSLGLCMMIYVDIGFKTWMPNHLQETFGLSKGNAALNAVLWHYLGAFVGVTLGGRISDKLAKSRPSVRMETNFFGLLLAIPFIVWMAYAPSCTVCCIAMAVFGVFRGVYDSNLMAALFDLLPARYHASGVGVMLCFSFVFGSFSPVVLGLMKEHFPSSVGLASLAAFYVIGALVILAARFRTFNASGAWRNAGQGG